MEKEPIKRYQTAKEMADVLKTIKEYPNFKININNGSRRCYNDYGHSRWVQHIGNDLTTVMSQASEDEKTTMNTDKEYRLQIRN